MCGMKLDMIMARKLLLCCKEDTECFKKKKKSIFFPLCNLLSQICFLRSEEERRKVILVSFILFLSILHVKMIQ